MNGKLVIQFVPWKEINPIRRIHYIKSGIATPDWQNCLFISMFLYTFLYFRVIDLGRICFKNVNTIILRKKIVN